LSLNHLSVKEGSFAAFQVRQLEAETRHFDVGGVIFSWLLLGLARLNDR